MTAAAGAESDFYVGRDLKALSGMSHYYGWIVDTFAPFARGAVIEYGAGLGTVSARLRPLVERLDLVEPSPNLAPLLREKFRGDPAVTVREESLERHAPAAPARAYDGAVLVNVLEHIADDRAALAELCRILRPGGHLMLFVPALPFLFSRLDALYGHHRRYRRTELVRRVGDAGFEILAARYLDLLGVVPWWVLNKLGGAVTFNPAMVRLYDRFGVPLTRRIERALEAPPFGKNVILVARKKL